MKRHFRKRGKVLLEIHNKLYNFYGPQRWWPGDTAFEIIIGAILTQNTSWSNVEKAVGNLKKAGFINPVKFSKIKTRRLASLIRPSGYYNIKAKRLRHFIQFLDQRFGCSLRKLFALNIRELRKSLLEINGIGQETADSIILYAAKKPVFVVDAYTKRILLRHKLVKEDTSYEELQMLFTSNLPVSIKLFNEYHALIVRVGKELCGKSKPKCRLCPLQGINNAAI